MMNVNDQDKIHCRYCKKPIEEDSDIDSCIETTAISDGKPLKRVPYAGDKGVRCNFCGVIMGGIHHGGCVNEKCPTCGKWIEICMCTYARVRWEDLVQIVNHCNAIYDINRKMLSFMGGVNNQFSDALQVVKQRVEHCLPKKDDGEVFFV